MEEAEEKVDHQDELETMVSQNVDEEVAGKSLDANYLQPVAEAITASPNQPHPLQQNRLDPFFHYKYADNRKLTLLKSLSQDSEYSLDTSLFDAEEFLQDMGFAGGSDPTIPDRFLPSLMQRLSRFPEAEMESLHDKIIQSIGCFKRKEGKRRLFRNLSIGRDPGADYYLRYPPNTYPLLRSNTDPTAFPFDETSITNSLHSGRPHSANDSGIDSLDSMKNERDLPTSPITILVSSASMEVEDTSSQAEADNDNCVQMLSHSEDMPEIEALFHLDLVDDTRDNEFTDTVEMLQQLTNKISNDEEQFSRNDALPSASQQFTENASKDEEQFSHNTSAASQQFTDEISKDEEQISRSSGLCSASQQFTDKISNDENEFFPRNEFLQQIAKKSSKKDKQFSRSSDFPPVLEQPFKNISNDFDQSFKINELPPALLERRKNLSKDMDQFSKNSVSSQPYQQDIHDAKKAEDDINRNKGFIEGSYNNKSIVASQVEEVCLNDCPKTVKASESSLPAENSVRLPHLESGSEEKCAVTKLPLRRLSRMHGHNLKTSRKFGSVERQSKIDEDDDSFSLNSEILRLSSSDGSYKDIYTSTIKNRSDEEGSDTTPVAESYNALDENNKFTTGKLSDSRTSNALRKHKYSRDDSLTNFLSSMLETSEEEPFSEIPSSSNGSAFPNEISESDSLFQNSVNIINVSDIGKKTVEQQSNKSDVQYRLNNTIQKLNSTKKKLHILQHVCSELKNDESNKADQTLRQNSSKPNFSSSDIVNNVGIPSKMILKNVKSAPANMNCNRESLDAFSMRPNAKCTLCRNSHNCIGDLNDADFQRSRTDSTRELDNANLCNCGKHCCKRLRYFSCPLLTRLNTCCNYERQCSSGIKSKMCDCYNSQHMADCLGESFIHNTGFESFQKPNCRDPLCSLPNQSCRNNGINIKHQKILDQTSPLSKFSNSETDLDYKKCYLCNASFDLMYDSYVHTPVNYKGDRLPYTPSYWDDNCPDDVFLPNTEFCSICCSHPIQNEEPKKPLRKPQRQNSVYADNLRESSNDVSEYFVPSDNKELISHEFTKQSYFYNSSSGKNTRTLPKIPLPKNSSDTPAFESLDHTPSTVSQNSNTRSSSEFYQPNSPNNKKEPLFERKIRIFSKFLAKLGNLSKSIDCDKQLSRGNDSKLSHAIVSDKETHCFSSSLCEETSAKCSTSSPEFDRLVEFFKSVESRGDHLRTSKSDLMQERLSDGQNTTESPLYENRVLLQTKEQSEVYQPIMFTSSVTVNVENGLEIRKEDSKRLKGETSTAKVVAKEDGRNFSTQMFRGVSKELEELQLSIRKAKEMRISAARELHLLQELLSTSSDSAEFENHHQETFETTGERSNLDAVTVDRYPNTDSYKALQKQALSDLQKKSQNPEDESFWDEEMKRVQKETNLEWQAKLKRMESRLADQEEEIHLLQNENENLQKHIESRGGLGSPTCPCKSDGLQNGRTDSAFEDDEEYINHKPSVPVLSTRQECDRLQEQLMKETQRADQLNLMLNQKSIEVNKLQLSLSKQTKEMIELEKSYLQLQCRLRRGTSKPVVARLCSRKSPFASKNLCPKPSPPASPHPHDNPQ